MNTSNWYENRVELLTFARVLNLLGAFAEEAEGRIARRDRLQTAADAAIYYFEKPWKWDREYARWVELGRPMDLVDMVALEPVETFTTEDVVSA